MSGFQQPKFNPQFQVDQNRLRLAVQRKFAIDMNFSKKIRLVRPPAFNKNFEKYVIKHDLYNGGTSFPYPTGKLTADLYPNIKKANLAMENQGSRPTCVLFATKFLLEYEYAREANFKKSYRFNPEFLLWGVRSSYPPNYDRDGAEYAYTTLAFENHGIANWDEDKVYGTSKADYDINYVPKLPTQQKAQPLAKEVALFSLFDHSWGLTDDEFCEILEVVNSGLPVGLSILWGNKPEKPGEKPAGEWYSVNADGVLVMDYKGTLENAHAVVCVGYKIDKNVDGGGYMVFHNSWGSAPIGGYIYLTFRKIKSCCRNAYIALPKKFGTFN
jgi:hypothetical protein